MITGYQVAEFLMSQIPEDHDPPVSVLQINLLLYLAQGWHLASFDTPVFSDPVEAWPGGPAVHSVWESLGGHGGRTIDETVLSAYRSMAFNIGQDSRTLMEMVWQSYGGTPVFELRSAAMQDPPFRLARRGLGPTDAGRPAIGLKAMTTHFRGLRDGMLQRATAGPVDDDADLQWLLSAAALHDAD